MGYMKLNNKHGINTDTRDHQIDKIITQEEKPINFKI